MRLVFAWQLEERLLHLSDALLAGTYQPPPEPVGYHHTDASKRIPVPCWEGSLALRALKQVLRARLERSFINDTHAGLQGRGVHRAVREMIAFYRRVAPPSARRTGWVRKADVQNFYPSLRHAVLRAQCQRRLKDDALLGLLARFVSRLGQVVGYPGGGNPAGLLSLCPP
jgi:RNA-directed DNA polymerase